MTPNGVFNLPGGAHSISASYSSDYSFKGAVSTSPALAFTHYFRRRPRSALHPVLRALRQVAALL